MTNGRSITKRDIIVLVVLIACMLVNLAAVGASGRSRAKEYVCQSNLRQWGVIFEGLAAENNGQIAQGVSSAGNPAYYWPWMLPEGLKDWTQNRIWLCPVATTPVTRKNIDNMNIYNSWGINTSMGGHIPAPKVGFNGSYGLNGYFIPIPGASTYQTGISGKDGWSLFSIKQPSSVPVMVDALRFDLWPVPTNAPAQFEGAAWTTTNHMANCCINRHNGAINCLFADGSVRKVGLKELWTLKWHQSFDTAGPWTLAGGVTPDKWPAWIRPFKDY